MVAPAAAAAADDDDDDVVSTGYLCASVALIIMDNGGVGMMGCGWKEGERETRQWRRIVRRSK